MLSALVNPPSLSGSSSCSRTLAPSLARARKIFEVRRSLALLGRHQQPVAADHVVLPADLHVIVALTADFLNPYRLRIALSAISLEYRPRPYQRMIDHGDFEDKRIGIGLVEMDALFDDGLVVIV